MPASVACGRNMIHLRSIDIDCSRTATSAYPFNLPLVQRFEELPLESSMVVFVGENGSGKSTILESLAAAIRLPTVGGDPVHTDPTLAPARDLAKTLRLVWSQRIHRGFFLRAEDFFNFTRRMNALRSELEELKREYDGREGDGWAKARAAIRNQRNEIVRRYGEDLDARSHGESFLELFQSRFVPNGIYLLDEPEAPLSPQRQLALISLMKQMVEHRSAQFIISTHSPILMGFPGAQIVSFDALPPRAVEYEDTEHVSLTRAFLTNRQAFLRHL